MAKISDEEIVDFLKNMLELNVTAAQLAKPNRDLVIGIYAQFLDQFGFDINSFAHRDFMACGAMTNIEAMDNILVPIHIFKAVQQYVEPLGFADMNLHDVLMPKRNRTNKIISLLCMFYLRYTNVMNTWLQIKKDGMNIHARINELQQKNLELKHAIEEKSMLLSSFQNTSVALEKEKYLLVEQTKKKKREVDEQSDQFQRTKSEILKLESQLSEMDLEISTTKERNKELEERIVRSPQKAIQITNELERQLDEDKKEVPSKKQQHMAILKKIDCHKAVFTSLRASTDDIQNLLLMLSATNDQCENLESIKHDASSLREQIKSIEIKTRENQVSTQGWRSKRNNSTRQYQRECGTLRDLNNGLQQTMKRNAETSKQLQLQKEKTQQKLALLETKFDQMEETFKALQERYEKCIDNVGTQMANCL